MWDTLGKAVDWVLKRPWFLAAIVVVIAVWVYYDLLVGAPLDATELLGLIVIALALGAALTIFFRKRDGDDDSS